MLPLADTAKQKGPAVVTKLVIVACVAVFGWQAWLAYSPGGRALASFVDHHALVAERIVHHPLDEDQWRTVFTHLFLHGGVLHLLGNMWFLWLFGANVEDRFGAFRFAVFYLLTGAFAAGVQVAAGPASALPMVGASGAISGVLGAYLILFPTALVWTLVPWVVPILPVPAVVFLVLWFVMQAYNGVGSLVNGNAAEGGVAWWAHAGGFVAGAVLALWARGRGWVRRR
ncbi:MAG: rhomboid family intramembrane serine protease [Verrucomicrobia bacterium]|nr:rhomboid family intramembrane serine protease [Verrucomicrobiota bacterium]